MKSLRHIFLYCIIFFNNAPLASEIDNSYQSQSLLAVLFKRTSAEFKANTFQVYSSAQKNIDKALEEHYSELGLPVPNWKKKKDPDWWTEYLEELGIDPQNQ